MKKLGYNEAVIGPVDNDNIPAKKIIGDMGGKITKKFLILEQKIGLEEAEMINSMRVKSFLILLILIFSVFTIFTSPGKSYEVDWWNDDWSYNMKIDIPFDTSNSKAKFQPIDTIIKFDNPCWAEDTKTNSIRVCCLNKGKWYELESQIYNLKFDKDSYIIECGLVFLIPEYCDGLEEYYVYYDDSQKISPDYTDHLDVRRGILSL